MSPEAQRIAIAELCGWFPAERGVKVWYDPEGGHVVFNDLPDYLNDLNAMHEAEKKVVLPYLIGLLFIDELCAIWRRNGATEDEARRFWGSSCAAWRGEALLRANGKWTE